MDEPTTDSVPEEGDGEVGAGVADIPPASAEPAGPTVESGVESAISVIDTRALRRAMWQWVAAMVGFVVAAAIVGGLLFKVPYVALVPGSARDTEPLLEVEGIERFPSDGELMLTTVRVQQRPNLWQYLWLQADDDADVVAEELILGDRTPDENRELNLQLMNDSKSVAIAVALEELGYEAIKADGVVILSLVEGTAADGVLEVGDTVVAIDDEPIATTGELVDTLAELGPGDEIVLSVERFDPDARFGTDDDAGTGDGDGDGDGGGDEDGDGADSESDMVEPAPELEEIAITLGSKPDDADAAFLGVEPTDRVELIDDFGFTVDIESGSVGGPSAGLAFTLAVLDDLTAGELTGGHTVAVTGTIDVAGRVGSVGGVVQKTAAVRELGADVFIVPAELAPEELERVRERAGDDLEIIPVATLEEALDALAGLGGEVDAVTEFAASHPS
jgi:PDZ domain-containing protein